MGLLLRYRREGRRWRGARVALCVWAGSLLTLSSVVAGVAGPLPAAADQIAAIRQQIAGLEAEAAASAARVHQLTTEYQAASVRAGVLAAEEAAGRAEVGRLTMLAGRIATHLRQEAIDSYTGAYTGVPGTFWGSGAGVADPAVRAEYVSLASGDLADTLDSYRASRQELASAQIQLAEEERHAAAALRDVAAARRMALAQAVAEQNGLDKLESRLSTLQAAQTEVAARVASKAASLRGTWPATGPSSPQGLPVGDGLVKVVETALAPPPAPPAPAPPTPEPAPRTPAPLAPIETSTSPSGAGGAGKGAGSASEGAGGVWLQLRECESGDNYRANTGNGYYGAYQFSQQTWSALGYAGRPDLAPPASQDAAARKLQAEAGWGQWPACAAALGLA